MKQRSGEGKLEGIAEPRLNNQKKRESSGRRGYRRSFQRNAWMRRFLPKDNQRMIQTTSPQSGLGAVGEGEIFQNCPRAMAKKGKEEKTHLLRLENGTGDRVDIK